MTTARTEDMNQSATYWAPGLDDGYGGLDFTSVVPVLIACRWQNASVMFRDAQGQMTVSEAVIYPDRLLAIGGYLVEGDAGAAVGADPRVLGSASEIRQIGASPSLLNDEVLHKVYL